uniref:Uncharacterized protein n=1 Tax=Anguilla anguilla TaxID=7936 RepID=A0A0E9S5R7_ANGAN
MSVMGSLITPASLTLCLMPHLKDDISYSTASTSPRSGTGDYLTRGKIVPYWPTNTTSSNNLVFPVGLQSK